MAFPKKGSRIIVVDGVTYRFIDHASPYVVRQVILIGLSRGWRPEATGREVDVGSIDDQIDWTLLKGEAR